MTKFEIYRADIDKVLVTVEKPTDDEAFGAWASAAMVAGFLPMSDKATEFLGGSSWKCTSAAGKSFVVEARPVA